MKTVRVTLVGAMTSVALLIPIHAVPAAQIPQVVWQTNAHYVTMSVAYSRDGQLLGSGGGDSSFNIWRTSDKALLRTFGPEDTDDDKGTCLAFSPDGTRIAGGGDYNRIRLWDIASGRRLWGGGSGSSATIYSLSFSSDGLRLAVGGTHGGVVGDASTGLGDIASVEYVKTVSTVFSADGTKLARAVHINPMDEDEPLMGYARILNASTYAALHTLTGHSNHVYSVDFSPDGQLLLTTSLDGTARLWNMESGECVRVIEGGGGVFGKFSADGKTFFTCAGVGTVDFLYDTGTLKFWRTSDGALLASFDNLGAGPIAVSPAGKYFAYGKADGSLVVAYVPLWIESITRANNKVTLRWQNGSGKYQVQATTNLTSAPWANLGPVTTNTTFTHTCLSPLFYRVQSLPNP